MYQLVFDHLKIYFHPREDELAPGIVVIAAIISGLVFAFIGNRVQYYLANKRYYSYRNVFIPYPVLITSAEMIVIRTGLTTSIENGGNIIPAEVTPIDKFKIGVRVLQKTNDY